MTRAVLVENSQTQEKIEGEEPDTATISVFFKEIYHWEVQEVKRYLVDKEEIGSKEILWLLLFVFKIVSRTCG